MNDKAKIRKLIFSAIVACALIVCGIFFACQGHSDNDAVDSIGEADSVTNVDDITDAGISDFSYEYGVFLSAEPGDVDAMKEYRCVVIDAQEFSAEDIRRMHDLGQTVYSYINIGSVEKFRDYYDDYADITLGKYENWEDESWVDVSSDKWQKFITGTLAKDLEAKGIDGFFVDNADVYYQYPTSKIYEGVCDMLKALRLTGKEVILNGGDTFVSRYLEDGAELTEVITGVNQENVITAIDWANENFALNSDEDRAYFEECIERVAKAGGKVYMLEYTDDADIIRRIDDFARAHRYVWYAADSPDLNAGGGIGMSLDS